MIKFQQSNRNLTLHI